MGSKWYDAKIKKQNEIYIKVFLKSVGLWFVNQMVENAHVISGLLRNSITYNTGYGDRSEFGNEGTGKPSESDKIEDTNLINGVRAGSALVYANRQNILNGWADKSLDEFVRGDIVGKFAKRIFKW